MIALLIAQLLWPFNACAQDDLRQQSGLESDPVVEEMTRRLQTRPRGITAGLEEPPIVEELYQEQMSEIVRSMDSTWLAQGVDGIVGVPFFREAEETVQNVLIQIWRGLQQAYPDRRFLVIAIGEAQSAIQVQEIMPISTTLVRGYGFYKPDALKGKGWSLRMLIDLARRLDTHVGFFDADLTNIEPDWVRTLFSPVFSGGFQGSVLPQLDRGPRGSTMTNHLVYPLLSAIYGRSPRQPLSGQRLLTRELVREVSGQFQRGVFSDSLGRYGIDLFLTWATLRSGFGFQEPDLGALLHTSATTGEAEDYFPMFRQVVGAAFDRIVADDEFWVPLGAGPPSAGSSQTTGRASRVPPDAHALKFTELFREHFRDALPLTRRVLGDQFAAELERLHRAEADQVYVSADRWSEMVYRFLTAYAFGPPHEQEPLLRALFPIFCCRVASFDQEVSPEASRSEVDAAVDRSLFSFSKAQGAWVQEWRSRKDQRTQARRVIALAEEKKERSARQILELTGWDATTLELFAQALQALDESFRRDRKAELGIRIDFDAPEREWNRGILKDWDRINRFNWRWRSLTPKQKQLAMGSVRKLVRNRGRIEEFIRRQIEKKYGPFYRNIELAELIVYGSYDFFISDEHDKQLDIDLAAFIRGAPLIDRLAQDPDEPLRIDEDIPSDVALFIVGTEVVLANHPVPLEMVTIRQGSGLAVSGLHPSEGMVDARNLLIHARGLL